MFKSSENLRLAAEMRALERVARPWREVRVSWFDGTPESIEARLAATERVLTYARGGTTTAHMALEREAATARAELKEASHRLLVDFLDDGARAFKGSRRVAERGLRECINCGGALSGEEDDDKDSECGTCGESAHEPVKGKRKSSSLPSLHTAGQEVVWEGKACPDCAMAIANGDDSGASDEWSWDKLEQHTSQLPGDSGPIIACGEDDDCDSHFQRGPCDTCGSPYDGTFHRVVTMGPTG